MVSRPAEQEVPAFGTIRALALLSERVMAAACEGVGLKVRQYTILSHLEARPGDSIAGIAAATAPGAHGTTAAVLELADTGLVRIGAQEEPYFGTGRPVFLTEAGYLLLTHAHRARAAEAFLHKLLGRTTLAAMGAQAQALADWSGAPSGAEGRRRRRMTAVLREAGWSRHLIGRTLALALATVADMTAGARRGPTTPTT